MPTSSEVGSRTLKDEKLATNLILLYDDHVILLITSFTTDLFRREVPIIVAAADNEACAVTFPARSSAALLILALCAYLFIDSSKVLRRVFIFNHSEPRLCWLLESKQKLQLRAHLQNLTSRIAQKLVLLLTPISSTKDKIPNLTNLARDSIVSSTVSQGAEENESGTSLHL